MEALGALSPIESARAAVQAKIADFLAARARLIQLMKSSNLQIQGQANVLYQNQVALENQLYDTVMPKLSAIQSGQWQLSDVALLGGFTTSIIQQINSVDKLYVQAGGTLPSTGFDITTVAVIGTGVLALGLLGGFFAAKR